MTHKTVKQITKAEAVDSLINGKIIAIGDILYKFKTRMLWTHKNISTRNTYWTHNFLSVESLLKIEEPIFLMEENKESED